MFFTGVVELAAVGAIQRPNGVHTYRRRNGKEWQKFEFFGAAFDARRWLDLNQLTAWREHSGGDVCAIFP